MVPYTANAHYLLALRGHIRCSNHTGECRIFRQHDFYHKVRIDYAFVSFCLLRLSSLDELFSGHEQQN